jgi:hypothetical protein
MEKNIQEMESIARQHGRGEIVVTSNNEAENDGQTLYVYEYVNVVSGKRFGKPTQAEFGVFQTKTGEVFSRRNHFRTPNPVVCVREL